ncbi:MAG: signal peptidase II [Phycisphaerae bacterium]
MVAAVGLTADLLSKHLAFQKLSWDQPLVVIPGVLRLQPSLNPGALFGLGVGLGPLFVVASLLALVFVIYVFVRSAPQQRWLHVALGMVLAGALGNLYDRLFVLADVVWSGDDRVIFVGRALPSQPGELRLARYSQDGHVVTFRGPPTCTVRRQRVVRDFIKIETTIGGRELWRWVFNVADALLVLGVALLMLSYRTARRTARLASPPGR